MNKIRLLLTGMLVALIFGAFALTPALAQRASGDCTPSAERIGALSTIGVTVGGGGAALHFTLGSGGHLERYIVRALDPAVNPTMEVIDADGNSIAFNDDHGTARPDLGPCDSLLEDLTLPQLSGGGKYTLLVSGADGSAAGRAQLLIGAAPPPAETTTAESTAALFEEAEPAASTGDSAESAAETEAAAEADDMETEAEVTAEADNAGAEAAVVAETETEADVAAEADDAGAEADVTVETETEADVAAETETEADVAADEDVAAAVGAAEAQSAAPELEFAGDPDFPALEFPSELDWLNVPAPLQLSDLQGKVVLLDFWTYGCINCIHMIPIVDQLETKYADELVVIGVHSAKFDTEGQTENIRQIVQRYELEHPVVNDNEFAVWNTYRRYGVNAWPTYVLIDPRGNVFASQAGEIPFDIFDRVVGGMVAEFDALGEINREPVELAPESANAPNRVLAFPGKVLADEASNRLFIADSNHHRIIVSDLDTYEVLAVIGTGRAGQRDGSFDTASFNRPQGMALEGDTLYVADTENHTLRQIDLEARNVITIAGTGRQVFSRTTTGPALQIGLNSPWDLELVTINERPMLAVAMAGPHQLWAFDLQSRVIGPFVGSGIEGLLDGSFEQSQLAQPSGLYFVDGLLYVADSESSSIRIADLTAREIRTVAGPTENNLFLFGDEDGAVGVSRLQHPLGVEGGPDGQIFVADTYNSRIKVLDPESNTITALAGLGGMGGFRDGTLDEAQFDEPGGIAYADGRLFIADTNNHAIRVLDLSTNEVSTITFPNAETLLIEGQATVVGSNSALGIEIELPEQVVAPGAGEIVLDIQLPEGFILNTIAPFTGTWTSSGEALHIAPEDASQSIVAPEIPVTVPVSLTEGSDVLHGDLTIYYCEYAEQNLCFIDEIAVTAPVTVSAEATGSAITVTRALPLPETFSDLGGL